MFKKRGGEEGEKKERKEGRKGWIEEKRRRKTQTSELKF